MDAGAGGYSGSESYRYVEPILKDSAGELLVISPYIGMGYAKMLVSLGKRKRVRVITSSYSEPVKDYISHRSRHLLYGYVKVILLFAIAAAVSVYFGLYAFAMASAAVGAVLLLIALALHRFSRNSDIEIRISYDKFVHEKAYISRDAAAVGSANLTYSGMRKNVERVEVIKDSARIEGIRRHFFDLWENCS